MSMQVFKCADYLFLVTEFYGEGPIPRSFYAAAFAIIPPYLYI